jgi:HAD superfamily hydrolase (TIGR01549 family)
LKEVFDTAFFPVIGIPPDNLQVVIDHFYLDIFPSLRDLTQFRAEAVKLVEKALARGYQVAIATSSLFPRVAVDQRLEWAGLSPSLYPFQLVASYETFHFSKPNPAYYTEILARLGWPEGPVVMVGDDLQNDIEPARRVGLAAFWISMDGKPSANALNGPSASGDLVDFFPWLDSASQAELIPDFNQPESMEKTLRATPAALDSLTAHIPHSYWTYQPDPDEWSLTEILCHLRDVDQEVNLPRLKKVLRESNPFLAGMDTDPWAAERQYKFQDGKAASKDFTRYRLEILSILEQLSTEDWDRPARHAIFGPTLLLELVSIVAGHDRLHLRQISNTLHLNQKAISAGQ